MIWFFIAGWIAGSVFMILYAHEWVHRHSETILLKKEEEKEEKSDD